MNEIVEKISSYNIFNNLLPGVLFATAGNYISEFTLVLDDLFLGVFVYYFYGLVISRLGSLIIEPILEKAGLIKSNDYSDFIKASKLDTKIEILLEACNMYRSLSTLLLSLLALSVTSPAMEANLQVPASLAQGLLILLLILFSFSYKKQSEYLFERINEVNAIDNLASFQ